MYTLRFKCVDLCKNVNYARVIDVCLYLIVCRSLFQTELSQNLQQLSEKARTTTEFIQRLKQMSEKLNVSRTRAVRSGGFRFYLSTEWCFRVIEYSVAFDFCFSAKKSHFPLFFHARVIKVNWKSNTFKQSAIVDGVTARCRS